jgi:signal transduction histidine kinase
LKRVEKEAFLKSFFLFFLLQIILVGGIYFLQYQKALDILDKSIFSQMRLCSFSLDCKKYTIDFVEKKDYELYRLYKTQQELSSYFPITNSNGYFLKISLSKQHYQKQQKNIQKKLLMEFFAIVVVLFVLSVIFALYTMAPLRNALHLTEEFIKDILHDFNTPLATLRLNVAVLESKCHTGIKQLNRIKKSVQTILHLQENLRAYLHSNTTQISQFDLANVVQERVENLQALYPHINFFVHVDSQNIITNQAAFERILDNLLSNAAKYNKDNGFVKIYTDKNFLIVEDSGKGIKDTHKIFERFYKEQDRGIGIGLHIVKKLCDELRISIDVKSKVAHGSKFFLNIKNLLQKTL